MKGERSERAEGAGAPEDGGPQARALERDGFACQLCGSRRDLQVHHLRFRSQGGDDSEDNLVTLCLRCHSGVHGGLVRLGGP